MFGGDRAQLASFIDGFLATIGSTFPSVCIDQNITNPDNLASTPRGPWNFRSSNWQT